MLSDKRKAIKITLGNRAFFLLSILCDFVTFCKKDVIIFAMKQPANRFEIEKRLEKPLKVLVFDSLDSTNTRAKAMLKDGENDDFLIVAREQTKGRGRFERKFYSPKDAGVYFSLVVTPKTREEIAFYTPICAIATADAVRSVCGKNALVKWVNDVYVDGKKCAGILCEATSSKNGEIDKVVMGIGVNLYEKDGGFDEEIKDKACAVADGVENASNRIVATIVNEIRELIENFDKEYIVAKYRRLSMLIGKKIEVCKEENSAEKAIAVDIDENCGLIVRYGDGKEENLRIGEVKILC